MTVSVVMNLKGMLFLLGSLLFLGFVLVGCTKATQHAIVIDKAHIAAHVEGTEYKEREMDHEQWLVKVQIENGPKANAPVDQDLWNALKVGDRVRAKYSRGNYTGTIWAIDIEKP
jgi:hypothetical protein